MSEQTTDNSELLFAEDSANADGVTEPGGSTVGDSTPKDQIGLREKNKQIDVWATRILNGESSINDLPKNLAWLKPLVADEVNKRNQQNDVKAIVAAEWAQREAEAKRQASESKFNELKLKATKMGLSESDQALVQAKFERLRANGLDKAIALEEALEAFEIVNKAGEQATMELKKRMQVPSQTKSTPDTEPEFGTPEFFQKGDSKTRIERMENIMRGR